MNKRIYSLALSGIFTLGLAVAAPQDQQAPPPDQPMAQDQAAPGGRGGMRMDPARQLQMMAKRLNLSGDQMSQIKPIIMDHAAQAQAARADSSVAPRDRMEKMRAIQADADTKITAILTPDQRVQYEQMKAQRRQMMHDRMSQGAGAPDAAPSQQ